MIPKKIHYVWLSEDGKYPNKVADCLAAWKNTHPDYELIEWNLSNFDIEKAPQYVKDAYKDKAWAFCSDYIRAYIVYNEGGWYIDTDVMPFTNFLDNFNNERFVAGIEDYVWDNPYGGKNKQTYWNRIDKDFNNISGGYIAGILMNPVLFGAEKKHPFLNDIINYYSKLDYCAEVDDGCLFTKPIAPQIYTKVLEKYGWKYKNGDQCLNEGIKIFDNNIVRHYGENPKPGVLYSYHLCTWTWLKKNNAKIR